MIYKFSPSSEYALDNLKNRHLFCRHYSDFNDPFEFRTKVYSGTPNKDREYERFIEAIRAWGFTEESWEDPKEYFDSLEMGEPPFQTMIEEIRVSCFGSDDKNLLMWSHYADGLRGFCAAYDPAALVSDNNDAFLADVAYLLYPPIVDSFVYAIAEDQYDFHMMALEEMDALSNYIGKENNPDERWRKDYEAAVKTAWEQMTSIWQKVFAAKSTEWEYEKEQRLLVRAKNKGNSPEFFSFSEDALKEIIVDEKISNEYRKKLEKELKKFGKEIPIKVAIRSCDSYQIKIKPA